MDTQNNNVLEEAKELIEDTKVTEEKVSEMEDRASALQQLVEEEIERRAQAKKEHRKDLLRNLPANVAEGTFRAPAFVKLGIHKAAAKLAEKTS